MNIIKWIKIYAAAMMIYGAYSLLGTGSYKHFAVMFKGLPGAVTVMVYVFSIFYGICGVYCGARVLRFQDWARKAIVIFTAISVVLGFMFNRIIMANFREFVFSGDSGIQPEIASSVYKYMIMFLVLTTVFELSVVIFFTRSKVVGLFRLRETA